MTWQWGIGILAVLAAIGGGAAVVYGPIDLESSCRRLGLCAEPDPAPDAFDILCDASLGSSCDKQSLVATLEVVLPYLAARPGSRIRVWILGSNVAETRILGELEVTKPKKGGRKAQKAHQEQFVESAKIFLLKAADAVLGAPPKLRTPLAEGASRVALSTPPAALERTIIIITDAREVSNLGDWECAPLPSAKQFLKRLRANGLLAPESLKNIRLQFTWVEMRRVIGRRCNVTLAREHQIRVLWHEAFRAAGAAHVRFEDGVVPLPGTEVGED